MKIRIGYHKVEVVYNKLFGRPNFIEQMKYAEMDYGIWLLRTREAAENFNTICIWKIKWKS